MRRTTRDLALCIWFVALVATTATAQQPAPAPTAKWEVSVHFGAMVSTNPSGGTFTPPTGNQPLPLATGGSGPRISSWFFGEGAKLLNDVNAGLGSGARVTSLDGPFGSSMTHNPRTFLTGLRIARVLTPRVTAELSIDYGPTGTRTIGSAAGSLRGTRETFASAMRQVFVVAGTFPSAVTTESAMGPGAGGQWLTTGVLKVVLPVTGPAAPFVTAGGGVVSQSGDQTGGRIAGNYSTFFTSPCFCRTTEHDELLLRASSSRRQVLGVVGFGVDYQPTARFWRGRAENRSRWGVRIEGRLYLSSSGTETFVDTHHSFSKGDAGSEGPPDAGVLVIGTSPAAQFSNDPDATGFESSLSGQPLTNVRVFEGRGMRTRVAITTGLFVRF